VCCLAGRRREGGDDRFTAPSTLQLFKRCYNTMIQRSGRRSGSREGKIPTTPTNSHYSIASTLQRFRSTASTIHDSLITIHYDAASGNGYRDANLDRKLRPALLQLCRSLREQ
jgi:hypothetical protein